MNWLKHVILDLAVTAVILVAVTTHQSWAWWIIAVYSPLMLALKLAALLGRTSGVKTRPTGVPSWFYHALYAVNVVALVIGRFWWIAVIWLAIWLLSYLSERKAA